MIGHYRLDDDMSPVLCHSMDEYYEWHGSLPESSDWYSGKTGFGLTIGKTQVGDTSVSTVFIPIDMGFGDTPVLWETMTFPGSELCERYTSHADAVEGHRKTVESLMHGEAHVDRC